jgi:hypothetical protein
MTCTSSYTLAAGPESYSYVFRDIFEDVRNCNGKFQNTRIVVAFLQLCEIIMACNQITLKKGGGVVATEFGDELISFSKAGSTMMKGRDAWVIG